MIWSSRSDSSAGDAWPTVSGATIISRTSWRYGIGADSGDFEFAFFNLAPGSRSVSRGAECGHAAVAVTVVAGPTRPDHELGEPVRIRNVDTGQILEVPAGSGEVNPLGSCRAKILHEPPIGRLDEVELTTMSSAGKSLHWTVIPAGNIFALVPNCSTCNDEAIRRDILSTTLQWARDSGLPNGSEEFIRTICHEPHWEEVSRCRVEVVFWNGVERHNSLPVSGATMLCNHLALERLASSDGRPPDDLDEIEIEFDVNSITRMESVTVHARRIRGSWVIVATSCSTTARLLFEGTAFLTP